MNWIKQLVEKEDINYIYEDLMSIENSKGIQIRFTKDQRKVFIAALESYCQENYRRELESIANDNQESEIEEYSIQIGQAEFFINSWLPYSEKYDWYTLKTIEVKIFD